MSPPKGTWRLSPAAEVVGMFAAVGLACGTIGFVVGTAIGGHDARALAREATTAEAICRRHLAAERDILSRVACPAGQRPSFSQTVRGPTLSCVPERGESVDGGIIDGPRPIDGTAPRSALEALSVDPGGRDHGAPVRAHGRGRNGGGASRGGVRCP